MTRFHGHFAAATCATLLLAVNAADAQPRTRDSAGVRVIETAPRTTAPVNFSLGAVTLDLGGLKQNPDDEFSTYGVLRNLRFSDGSIVALDDGKVRFYDAAGRQTNVVGRKGQGPGEFERAGSMCITRGDTLVVGDDSNRRFTVMDKRGKIVREIPVGRGDLLDRACFDDGTFLISESAERSGDDYSYRYIRMRVDGSVADTMGVFWRGRLNSYVYLSAAVMVAGQRVYMSDPRHSEVKIFDPRGKLIQIMRTGDPIQKVTPEEAARMAPMAAGAGSGARNPPERPKPTEWPSFARIDMDEGGRLWIEDFRRDRTAPNTWTAISPEGHVLGKFSMPAVTKVGDPRVRFFTRDGVLIRRQDAEGAEHLITYTLVHTPR